MKMKIYITILSVLFFCSCKKSEYSLPPERDIKVIIQNVYDNDYFFKIFQKQDLPLDSNLVKLQIDFSGQLFSSSHYKISHKDLFGYEVAGRKIFSASDSSYFQFQNFNSKSFRLNKKDFPDIVFESKNPLNLHNTISFPIFSLDQNFAYVVIEHSGDGGGGYAVILEKKGSNWKIVKQVELWDS